MFTSQELKWFPPELMEPIVGSMEQSIQTLAMPHQIDLSINACLGKKDGLRTITLTSLLYAIWNRSQTVVRDWEMENLKDFDTCKPGSSGLLAALGRTLQAEIAYLLEQKIGGFFHDYHIFSIHST